MIRSIYSTSFMAFIPDEIKLSKSILSKKFEIFCKRNNYLLLKNSHYQFAVKNTNEYKCHELHKFDEFLVCDIFPGKIESGRNVDFSENNVNFEKWHNAYSDEYQVYNLAYLSDSNLNIESDALGLKPLYTAHHSEGLVLSTQISNIHRLSPDLLGPVDKLALAQLFLAGFPFGARTTHSNVKRTKSGECIKWDRATSSVKIDRHRRISLNKEIKTQNNLIDLVTQLHDAISDSINRRTKNARKPLNIGLSGGYDSRILAAIMTERKDDFKAFTYGRWHHREVMTSKKIANILNIPHNILPYNLNNHYDHFDYFLSTMEGQSDSNSIQITNLFQTGLESGAPVLHGFMSDAVAETQFSKKKDSLSVPNLDMVAHGLAGSIWNNDFTRNLISGALEYNLQYDEIFSEIRNDLSEDGLAYHASVLWTVENKQRRYIGSHLPMLGQYFDIITPFYDSKIINIWFSLPHVCLDERYLQKQLLAKLYPEAAKIAHSESTVPIIPNLSEQLSVFLDSVLRKSFSKMYQKTFGYRVESIWSMAGGMASHEQQENMQKLFNNYKNSASELFGLDSFLSDETKECFFQAPARGDFKTPRLIFQTAAYAHWLQNLK